MQIKKYIINKSMKRKDNTQKLNLIFTIFIFIIITTSYGQKGFDVDKDFRIEKYQSEMIKYLIDNSWLEKQEKGKIIISNYSSSMGIRKYIEVFPTGQNKVLLVRFYSLGSHALNYWGILEKDNSLFFYYDEKHEIEIAEKLKKYDEKTIKIILSSIKIFDEWWNR